MKLEMKILSILTLCLVLSATALFGGCANSSKKKATKTESTTEETVVKKDPLTLQKLDELFKNSQYYKNVSKGEDTSIKTEVAEDGTGYIVSMKIQGTKYKAKLDYKDGKLTGTLSQDAAGYLTYMIMNYIANDVSLYFNQPRGIIDYMFTAVTTLSSVGDYDKYGFLITDSKIELSLNKMDFSKYKITALSLGDKDISSAISMNNTSDKEANIADDSPISVSNGFISLTTNNSDKDKYELNIVALTGNKYKVKKAVYDSIIRVAGYYNNGDSKYMSDFLTGVKDLDKSKKSSDSKLELVLNDKEKTKSIEEYNGFKKSEFTVYTIKFDRDLVTPVSHEGVSSDASSDATTE